MKRLLPAIVLLALSVVPLTPRDPILAGPEPESSPQLPQIPTPAPVVLDARTTAFLVLDLLDTNCLRRPDCVAGLPAVAGLLQRARSADVPVVYAVGAASSNVLPEVAPRGEEPLVPAPADKFLNPDFDRVLRERSADTVVIVGTSASGAVLYTSYGANARGYTVVVAEDGISADNEFQVFLARYQLLNQPGFSNPQNLPLQPNAVTLSRTDLITFR